MRDDVRLARRVEILRDRGASGGVVDELLEYSESPYRSTEVDAAQLPLPDEPHIGRWLEYMADAETEGVFATLAKRLIQLRFPVRSGMSGEDAYRRATRRGQIEAAEVFSPGLVLRQPGHLSLEIHETMGGRLPVLVTGDRDDFVALVQALSDRNEPEPVPASMGACIVSGLNNWDRIAQYRTVWEGQSGVVTEDAWAEEFRRLVPRKELYQDRFIILSRGQYSATPARFTGCQESDWLDRSLVLRREHEFVHYFTHRTFGLLRSNALDEMIADFVGLIRAFGEYRGDLALRFMGLEHYPEYRAGGRLENYRGTPSLSDEAMRVLGALVVRSVANLRTVAVAHAANFSDLGRVARLTEALVGLSIEELASPDMADLVDGALAQRNTERIR
jgi:hypothetical protein